MTIANVNLILFSESNYNGFTGIMKKVTIQKTIFCLFKKKEVEIGKTNDIDTKTKKKIKNIFDVCLLLMFLMFNLKLFCLFCVFVSFR